MSKDLYDPIFAKPCLVAGSLKLFSFFVLQVKQLCERDTNRLMEQLTALGEEKARALKQVKDQQAALDSFQKDAAAAKEQASEVSTCYVML